MIEHESKLPREAVQSLVLLDIQNSTGYNLGQCDLAEELALL